MGFKVDRSWSARFASLAKCLSSSSVMEWRGLRGRVNGVSAGGLDCFARARNDGWEGAMAGVGASNGGGAGVYVAVGVSVAGVVRDGGDDGGCDRAGEADQRGSRARKLALIEGDNPG